MCFVYYSVTVGDWSDGVPAVNLRAVRTPPLQLYNSSPYLYNDWGPRLLILIKAAINCLNIRQICEKFLNFAI